MPSHSLTKAEKTLAFVCVFAILPLSAIVYVSGERHADPKWNIVPAAPCPAPNGYDFYVTAAKATRRFTPEVDPGSDRTLQPPGSPYALKNYSLSRRLAWLRANKQMFSLIKKGASTSSQVPKPDYLIPPSDRSALRQLARDMSIRTHTFKMQGQTGAATMSALDTIQMGQNATRGGGLLMRLVGIEIKANGRDLFEDWNKTINSLRANEARVAARRLEISLGHEPTPTKTLTLEKRSDLLQIKEEFRSRDWRGPMDDKGDETPLQFWHRQTASKRTIYADLNRIFDDNIAVCKLPFSKAKLLPRPQDDYFNQWFVFITGRYFMREAHNTTSNNMLLLRLALRAYIAEYGHAPVTLSVLIPTYLKSIPTDTYHDGKPLLYKPQGKTYKLWSVGPDGVDDGGIPLARRPGEKTLYPVLSRPDAKGDFVAGQCR